jgi:hypothetical protein
MGTSKESMSQGAFDFFQTRDSCVENTLNTEKKGAPSGRFRQWASGEDASHAIGGVWKL